MKTILTVSALAAMVLVPLSTLASNASLYGNFRYSGVHVDMGDNPSITQVDGLNNASRLGVKASTEKKGLTGYIHYQMGAENDAGGSALTSRFYFAGVKGSFGDVKFGRLSTAYKMAAVAGGFDPFYDTPAGNGKAGANYGLSGLTNSFTDDSLEYNSPSMSGFKLNAGLYLDGRDDSVSGQGHGYGAGVSYSGSGITAKLQYLESDGANVAKATNVDNAIRLSAQYKGESFSVAGSYETISSIVASADDAKNIYLTATYSPIKDWNLAIAYGSEDDAVADGDFDGKGYSAGIFYTFLPRTQVYAMYSSVDADVDAGDRDTVALGVVYNFSLSVLE